MSEKRHVLVLGGTGEAVKLADRAARDWRVTYSLAGRTQAPSLPSSVEVRSGGFGGADALAAWIAEHRADAVIDATHPFADRIAANAAEACEKTGTPRLKLVRAPWVRHLDDDWREVPDVAAAAASLPSLGKKIFLSVGRSELAAFAGVEGKSFLVRTAEPLSDCPLAGAEIVVGRGPFSLAHEVWLLRSHGIDAVVSKNSGGDATYAKVLAARELGLPVVMVARPAPPAGPAARTIADAVAWLAALPRKEDPK